MSGVTIEGVTGGCVVRPSIRTLEALKTDIQTLLCDIALLMRGDIDFDVDNPDTQFKRASERVRQVAVKYQEELEK